MRVRIVANIWNAFVGPLVKGLSLRTLQVATFFFLEVISHAKDREILPRFGDRLRQRYNLLRSCNWWHGPQVRQLTTGGLTKHRYKESDEASRWLIALLIDDKRMLSQLLFECPVEEVRCSLLLFHHINSWYYGK